MLMPVGPRTKNSASARIAVPRSLPPHLRSQVRELVAVKSDNPGRGEADALLDSICCEADETKTALMLMVDGGDRERLPIGNHAHDVAQRGDDEDPLGQEARR